MCSAGISGHARSIGRNSCTGGGDGGGGGTGAGGRGGVIVPWGRHQNDRNGEFIPNPRPIQRLCILNAENTRRMCRDVALPTLGGFAFFKRWHMSYTCFRDFPRAASHLHPTRDIVDKVTAKIGDR